MSFDPMWDVPDVWHEARKCTGKQKIIYDRMPVFLVLFNDVYIPICSLAQVSQYLLLIKT